MSSKQIALAVGVLAAGICAAWPFRHERPPSSPAAATETNVTELTLRQQDVTLQPSPLSEPSPATDLVDMYESAPTDSGGRLANSRPALESLGLPPEMPPVFRSLILPVVQGRYAPDPNPYDPFEPRASLTPPGHAPTSPRPPQRVARHRIVDGDTLEKLAEHYLGDPARAGEIFNANRAVLDDPQLLPLGKFIELPPEQPGLEPVPVSPLE